MTLGKMRERYKDFQRAIFTLGIKVTCYPEDMEINKFRYDHKICLFNNSADL